MGKKNATMNKDKDVSLLSSQKMDVVLKSSSFYLPGSIVSAQPPKR